MSDDLVTCLQESIDQLFPLRLSLTLQLGVVEFFVQMLFEKGRETETTVQGKHLLYKRVHTREL